jgi:hypothetical protein
MGGQACVFYGAAEFSRDTDLAILADTANLTPKRPLLSYARLGDSSGLERSLRDEEDRERLADRLCWAPLRRELEAPCHRAQAAPKSQIANRSRPLRPFYPVSTTLVSLQSHRMKRPLLA